MSFVITTPLYYVNDKPHLGSIYTTLICDSIARYKRLSGEDVIFITGVDEHGLKIQRTAINKGVEPQSHCDEISDIFMKNWKDWDITNNKFVRTSSQQHEYIVNEFYNRVKKSDDIYMGVQKGWYCVGCEEFKDNPDNSPTRKCPIHQKNLEWKNEENLFFKLSKYQSNIEELINEPSFIQPKERRNEIINFVSKGLNDFSISRTNVSWGISVPDTDNHTFYVWFDALLGYVSALSLDTKNPSLEESINNSWPADIHLIGKDILRFHAIYWPAFLLAAKIDLPKKVYGHGWILSGEEKMSKSKGNILDPLEIIKKYGLDPLRYYLIKEVSFGNDGNISQDRLEDCINSDLANNYGNLCQRVTAFTLKNCNGKTPSNIKFQTEDLKILNKYKDNLDNIRSKIDEQDINFYIEYIVNSLFEANKYFNDQEPWKKKNDLIRLNTIVYTTLEIVRKISILLYPIIPDSSLKALKIFNLSKKDIKLESLINNEVLIKDKKINSIDILFKKIEKNND